MRTTKSNLSFPLPGIPRGIIAGFLVFCLLLNGFVPRFSIGQRERDVLSQLMARQTALLYFLSLSTLPEIILSDLFKKQNQAAPAAQKNKPPREQEDNSANSSSDYSLTAFDKKLSTPRLEHQGGTGKTVFSSVVSPPPVRYGETRKRCFDPPGSFYLILLLLFFSLARSSVNGNAAVLRLHARMNHTRLDKSRVFYLLQDRENYEN
ncbi:MAG: hypothetical protein ACYC5N_03065 [Endomicrobiales bacterium]